MEVVHACLRLVRSAPMTTAIQLASRLLILWGVLYMYPAVKAHENFYKMMFISWCLADITRYLFYLINIFMKPPRLLIILRYNLFLLLYPTGIAGEIALMLFSLPYAARQPWLQFTLPNALNFGFNTYQLYCLFLILYAPGSPVMYTHMLAQRSKVMGKKKVE
nr:protein tyrosine phosphatase protein [Hymenolepis microstoma]